MLLQSKCFALRLSHCGVLARAFYWSDGNRQQRPPLPPFSAETAAQKVRAAENAWNTRNPASVALAYTPDTRWRNRDQIFEGRAAVKHFLMEKWDKELQYRLVKELWCFTQARIGVRFAYEWHDSEGQWWRSYGNEMWEFTEDGLMAQRHASINDLRIAETERKLTWTPQGPRPDEFPGLTELGL
uniref:DUF1348 domain-containing protein n=1 Tax=Eutreptiella gymnastica TaxID=73025 RepID=A0A7S4LLK7_9EUGL